MTNEKNERKKVSQCEIIKYDYLLDNFKINIQSFYIDKVKTIIEKDSITIEFGLNQFISGIIDDNYMIVNKINLIGENSGSLLYNYLIKVFEDSIGKLELNLSWDKSNIKMIINQGNIEEYEF